MHLYVDLLQKLPTNPLWRNLYRQKSPQSIRKPKLAIPSQISNHRVHASIKPAVLKQRSTHDVLHGDVLWPALLARNHERTYQMEYKLAHRLPRHLLAAPVHPAGTAGRLQLEGQSRGDTASVQDWKNKLLGKVEHIVMDGCKC